MEAQVSLTVAFISSAFFGLLFLISLFTIPYRLANRCSDVDFQKNTMDQHQQMTLHLGNSPVLLLLSPGKTPLMTTVAKFLDTSVCGGS